MKIIGKTTIHPAFFYSGKISGYAAWVLYFLSIFDAFIMSSQSFEIAKNLSFILLAIGLTIAAISLINLGQSTSLGLPSEDTIFKNNGLYRFSRNPMYLGFNLITISSMIFTANIVIILLGIYSIVIYHFIIIGEEKFLELRFGKNYYDYKKMVRRYL